MKQIKRVVTDNVPVGLYLVSFDRIHSSRCNPGKHSDCLDHGCMDNGQEYIAEIEPVITKVSEVNYMGLTETVTDKDETWNATPLFEGDTHDLRPRLFKILKLANEHVRFTVTRFNNPQPWECFVKVA